MNDLVRFTLVFPPSLEDSVTDVLAACDGLPGFTLLHAEGHTSDFRNASTSERVRGRVQRRVLWMIIARAQVDRALDALRAEVAAHDVHWWLEPVLASGRLA